MLLATACLGGPSATGPAPPSVDCDSGNSFRVVSADTPVRFSREDAVEAAAHFLHVPANRRVRVRLMAADGPPNYIFKKGHLDWELIFSAQDVPFKFPFAGDGGPPPTPRAIMLMFAANGTNHTPDIVGSC
jgi:hypothetical protein